MTLTFILDVDILPLDLPAFICLFSRESGNTHVADLDPPPGLDPRQHTHVKGNLKSVPICGKEATATSHYYGINGWVH